MTLWKAAVLIILIVQFTIAAFMVRLDYELDRNREETLRNRALACMNRVLNGEAFDQFGCTHDDLLKFYPIEVRRVITGD